MLIVKARNEQLDSDMIADVELNHAQLRDIGLFTGKYRKYMAEPYMAMAVYGCGTQVWLCGAWCMRNNANDSIR